MLQPVYLAFAFDVSGSMGKLDYDYHDPVLKWEPVVAATKGFFADPSSNRISASLTFFPIDADDDERCDAGNYATPDVAMTELPSDLFAAAIDAITPTDSDDWRGGTPTLAALGGLLDSLEPRLAAEPGAYHALVLVSDGYPQGCDDNSIESVEDLVAGALENGVPTYVIGVQNPPGGPDTVTDLQDIAVAGGTGDAIIIETGDPEQTSTAFAQAIESIRERSATCVVEIPPPPADQVFNKDLVNVTVTSGGTVTELGYDPDAECSVANSWHYDDPANPSRIELCESTCQAVQADAQASLQVEFGCETRIVVQ